MFNNVQSARNVIETISNAFKGNLMFIERLRGETVNAKTDRFLINKDNVIADRLEADTVVPYLSGQSSSESQVSVVLGYLYAYIATSNPNHLTTAITYFDAYLNNFYPKGNLDKDDPGLPNWAINGKEPIMAHFPINDKDPRFSGYKSVPVKVINGKCRLPSGAPQWGNFLDVVTFAHRGHMETENIDSRVKEILDTVDWDVVYEYYRIDNPTNLTDSRAWINWNGYLNNVDGYRLDWSTKYIPTVRVSHFINWEGKDVTPDGKLWSNNLYPDDIGTVYFDNQSLNGVYLLNFAVKLPIGNGGRWINRNMPWDSSPLLVPLDPSKAKTYYNNGIDVEQITVELLWLMYTFTKQERYTKLLQSLSQRLFKYLNVSADDYFFRTSTEQTVPFIDGRVIDTYEPKDGRFRYDRDAQGNIQVTTYKPFFLKWDQAEMWYRINKNSRLITTYSGRCVNGSPVTVKCMLGIGLDKESSSTDIQYTFDLPDTTGSVRRLELGFDEIRKYINPITQRPYLVTDGENIVSDQIKRGTYVESVLGKYKAKVYVLPKGTHKLTLSDVTEISKLTVKSTDGFKIQLSDGQDVFGYDIPAGDWAQYTLDPTKWTNVSGLTYTRFKTNTVTLITNGDVSLWCVNELPELFSGSDGFTFNYVLSFVGEDAATILVGDCYVDKQRIDQFPYTPGVFPFMGPNELQIRRIPLLKGQPYPSHQYPFIYVVNEGMDAEMSKVIDFWSDSQTAYHDKFGIWGPGMAAYSWARWDNTQFSPPDSWTMYHWGDRIPWVGYHIRPFYNASKLAYELKRQGKPIPDKLKIYLSRWVGYISEYMLLNDNLPNVFGADKVPYTDLSLKFKPNEVALWLSSLSYAYLSDIIPERCVYATNYIFHELLSRYNVLDVDSFMNGSWSESVSLRKLSALDVGEMLKALSLYSLVQELAPGQDIYAQMEGKYDYIPDPNVDHTLMQGKNINYVLDESGDKLIVEGYKNG